MESLGEALRHFQNFSGRTDLEHLTAQVLQDPLVEDLRSRYPQLDNRILRINLNRLYQMSREHAHCRNCPGLEKCPNDMQGHTTDVTCVQLGDNWQLIDQKTACTKWIVNERQNKIRRNITSFFIDDSMFDVEYDDEEMLDIDHERISAVSAIQTYVNLTGEEGLQKRGLYLQGSFGTGKTYLAGYLLQKLAKEGFTGVIVYMPEFVEDAKALMFEPQQLKETMTLMKNADLLVFDDIGAENLSPWVRDHVLGAILNARMNRKPTFYTSNHDLGSLETHFSFTHKDGEEMHKGQRIMDRIRPFVDVVNVRGRNHRNG